MTMADPGTTTDALDLVVDAFEEQRFWDRVDDDFAKLRADPEASAAYDAERL